jgi:hypothetical protein
MRIVRADAQLVKGAPPAIIGHKADSGQGAESLVAKVNPGTFALFLRSK